MKDEETVLGDVREALLLGFVGVLGLCVGSFLNVVAYRLPRECMSISRPRSRCPRCAAFIAWYDNIPVLSWIVLKAQCRHCKFKISARYPLVEVFTAALFVLLALVLVGSGGLRDPAGGGSQWLTFGVGALIASVLLALALIDIDYFILPDELTKSGIVVGPLLAFLAPGFQHGRFVWAPFSSGDLALRGNAAVNGVMAAVFAGAILFGIGWLATKAFKKEAMGLGDVKMFAAMGGVLGVWVLLALAVAAIAGTIVGLVVRAITRGRYIPFGPFLGLGMLVVMLWGPGLLESWLGLFVRR